MYRSTYLNLFSLILKLINLIISLFTINAISIYFFISKSIGIAILNYVVCM